MKLIGQIVRLLTWIIFLVFALWGWKAYGQCQAQEVITIKTVVGTPESKFVKDKIELYKLLDSILMDDHNGVVDLKKLKRLKELTDKVSRQIKEKRNGASPDTK